MASNCHLWRCSTVVLYITTQSRRYRGHAVDMVDDKRADSCQRVYSLSASAPSTSITWKFIDMDVETPSLPAI